MGSTMTMMQHQLQAGLMRLYVDCRWMMPSQPDSSRACEIALMTLPPMALDQERMPMTTQRHQRHLSNRISPSVQHTDRHRCPSHPRRRVSSLAAESVVAWATISVRVLMMLQYDSALLHAQVMALHRCFHFAHQQPLLRQSGGLHDGAC